MNKKLVTIKRENIDENKIQGFIQGESDSLILLNYVYDFNLDGLMVLRKKDISKIESTDTDDFQTKLLKSEGVYSKINFNVDYNLSSWQEFFEDAIKKHKYFIVEEEEQESPEFTIGKIMALQKESITMKYFTGVARWLDELEKIQFSDLTSCQVGNNYLNVYEHYFEKQNV